MKEIRGLILRMLYLAKKDLRAFLVMNIVFVTIAVLCGISFRCGNLGIIYGKALEKYPESAENSFRDIYTFFVFMMDFMLCTMLVCIDIPVLMKDIRSGWNKYTYTLPVSMKKYAAANYILSGILTAVTMVLIILINLLLSVIFSQPFSLPLLFGSFLIMLLLMIPERIFYNLSLKVGDSKKAENIIIYSVVGFLILFPLLFILTVAVILPAFGIDDIDDEKLPALFLKAADFLSAYIWAVPFIAAAVLYLAYRRTVSLLERRIS